MKHYGSRTVTVIVTITREPAASCRGLFCFIQFEKKIEVICQFLKKSVLFILSLRPYPFPTPAALFLPIKGIKWRFGFVRRELSSSFHTHHHKGWKTRGKRQQTLEVCEPFSAVPLPNQNLNCGRSARLWFLPCKRPNCCSFCSRNWKIN